MGENVTRPARSHLGRRALRRFLLAGAALLAMTVFLLGAPLVLLALGNVSRSDWTQLSNVGQAYGGIAAVFGMLALVGVAASLVLQSRESAANRELVQRTIHSDLLLRALDDPQLRACWGPSRHGNGEQDRQHFYTNMIVSFWRSMFEIGKITEDQLRALSARMFASPPGRRYWSIAGLHQEAHYVAERDRKFVEILDREYARATADAGADEPPRTSPKRTPRNSVANAATIVALAAGLAGGTLISGALSMMRRRNRHRQSES